MHPQTLKLESYMSYAICPLPINENVEIQKVMYVAEKISNSEASSSNSDNIKMKKKVGPQCESETIIDFQLDF